MHTSVTAFYLHMMSKTLKYCAWFNYSVPFSYTCEDCSQLSSTLPTANTKKAVHHTNHNILYNNIFMIITLAAPCVHGLTNY